MRTMVSSAAGSVPCQIGAIETYRVDVLGAAEELGVVVRHDGALAVAQDVDLPTGGRRTRSMNSPSCAALVSIAVEAAEHLVGGRRHPLNWP